MPRSDQQRVARFTDRMAIALTLCPRRHQGNGKLQQTALEWANNGLKWDRGPEREILAGARFFQGISASTLQAAVCCILIEAQRRQGSPCLTASAPE
jgi:hypothetical protein